MAFFDDIGKKLLKSGQDTVKKAKSLADSAKINSQIAEEQRVLTTFYAQIGEKYYSLNKDDPGDEFSQYCDRITAGLERIAELQVEAQKLKNTQVCPKCGATCPANVQFCGKCGTQLPLAEVQPEDDPSAEDSLQEEQETNEEQVPHQDPLDV